MLQRCMLIKNNENESDVTDTEVWPNSLAILLSHPNRASPLALLYNSRWVALQTVVTWALLPDQMRRRR